MWPVMQLSAPGMPVIFDAVKMSSVCYSVSRYRCTRVAESMTDAGTHGLDVYRLLTQHLGMLAGRWHPALIWWMGRRSAFQTCTMPERWF